MQNIDLPRETQSRLREKTQATLRAELIGPAGFGKSKVIESIEMFATKWKKRDTILLTAFTGNAAQNINGINMHAAFGWSLVNEATCSITNINKLKHSRVRLVVIDEIGYCSQYLLGCVSRAFQQIFKNDEIMGGQGYLLVGDFLQMPPTLGRIIHDNRPYPRTANSDKVNAGEDGRVVASAINYRVKLVENMRHSKFPEFASVLDKIRIGKYDAEMVDYLNKTCVGKESTTDSIYYVPLITASNTTRFTYNRVCTFEYALKKNIPVYQIIATNKNTPYSMKYLHLRDDQCSKTHLLLELCIGMPVSCTTNDKKLKVTNGTMGYVAGFEWHSHTTFAESFTPDGGTIKSPSCHPKYVFVQLAKTSDLQFGNLPIGIVPFESVSKQIELKMTIKKKISALQFPLSPSWAITTDKVQGLTLTGAIIGPQSDLYRTNPPKQILYVALSRVVDPSTMVLSEPITLSLLRTFTPEDRLIEKIKLLETRCCREFY